MVKYELQLNCEFVRMPSIFVIQSVKRCFGLHWTQYQTTAFNGRKTMQSFLLRQLFISQRFVITVSASCLKGYCT